MPMNGNAAYGLLTGPSTETFLNSHIVTIAGSPAASAVLTYYIVDQATDTAGKQMFKVSNQNVPNSHPMPAHSIQMVQRAVLPGIANLAGYDLPENGNANPGPPIAVTGMLSGCSFLFRQNANGSLTCAHIKPPAAAPTASEKLAGIGAGTKMQVDLMNGASFAGGGAGNILVYGHDFYKPHRVTILGVRRPAPGGWELYAQKIQNDSPKLLGVTKIHPIH